MSILIMATNDNDELFLAEAYLQLFNATQGLAAIVPDALIEAAGIRHGELHFSYFEDGRLKSIYYRTCEEKTP